MNISVEIDVDMAGHTGADLLRSSDCNAAKHCTPGLARRVCVLAFYVTVGLEVLRMMNHKHFPGA